MEICICSRKEDAIPSAITLRGQTYPSSIDIANSFASTFASVFSSNVGSNPPLPRVRLVQISEISILR